MVQNYKKPITDQDRWAIPRFHLREPASSLPRRRAEAARSVARWSAGYAGPSWRFICPEARGIHREKCWKGFRVDLV